jgi:hypothetical protein
MNSKRQKCAMRIKAFRLFLIAALLAALVGSTIGVTHASDGAGNALDFDGLDDYVEISDNAALDANLGDSFTIEAWIRTREDDNSMIFAKHSGGTSGSYYLATLSGGGIRFQVITSNGRQWHEVSFSYNDDKWHHVAGVYDGEDPVKDLKIYVDGAQVGGTTSQEGNVNNTIYPVCIGFYDGDPDDWFYDGLYDEIRLWDDARTQTEIQANMHKTLTGSESGLVGYWKFDESSGTTATDSKGSNDGTLNNMEDSDWVTSGAFAGPRNALDFDGTNDYVKIDAVADDMAGLQSSFTFSAWVKAADTHTDSTKGTILGVNESSGDGSIKLCLFVGGETSARDNKITVYDGGYEITGPVIGDDTWHHVAYVRSSDTGTLYVDGASEDAYTANYAFDSNDLWSIGQEWDVDPWGVSDELDGQVDEVRIWNDVRTQTEIQDNMFTTLDGDESGLVAYYRFDYGTAGGSNSGITTLYDLTSNNNDGTLNNFALTGSTSNWVNSSAFNTWIGSEGTGWSTTGNWSRGSAPTSTDNVGIYSYMGGNSPSTSGATAVNHLTIATDATLTCSGNLTVNGNLSIASGATMEMGSHKVSVSGSTTNNGTLSSNETQSVTSGSGTQTFLDAQSNNASQITYNSGNEPGNTTVTTRIGSTIPANAFGSSCPAASSSVKRYYNVTADTSTGLNVTLRLYYDDAELNGQTEGSLKIYHCESGSWVEETGTYSRDSTNNYVEVTGVDSFSPFILGDSGPTAVTLARFTASPEVETWFLREPRFLAALPLVTLGAVGGMLLWRRQWRV